VESTIFFFQSLKWQCLWRSVVWVGSSKLTSWNSLSKTVVAIFEIVNQVDLDKDKENKEDSVDEKEKVQNFQTCIWCSQEEEGGMKKKKRWARINNPLVEKYKQVSSDIYINAVFTLILFIIPISQNLHTWSTLGWVQFHVIIVEIEFMIYHLLMGVN